MIKLLKKYWAVLLSAIAAVIIITTFIMNGSESEDLWLYIICIWLILYTGYDAYTKSK